MVSVVVFCRGIGIKKDIHDTSRTTGKSYGDYHVALDPQGASTTEFFSQQQILPIGSGSVLASRLGFGRMEGWVAVHGPPGGRRIGADGGALYGRTRVAAPVAAYNYYQ